MDSMACAPDRPALILLLGAQGQVGQTLQQQAPAHWPLRALGREGLDLEDPAAIRAVLNQHRPRILINAAAYTAVDQAEAEPGRCWQVNSHAVQQLAAWCAAHGSWLVHFSTDYVFDGQKNHPYCEQDTPHPLNVYGASKRAGEQAIAASGCAHVILRTSWVISAQGRNFVRTILTRAQQQPTLQVVDDQWGAPTPADWLAAVVWHMVAMLARTPVDGVQARQLSGLYHATAAGATSWHGLAMQVLQQAAGQVELCCAAPAVQPVPSSAYVTAAQRPRNSRLDCSKLRQVWQIHPPPWQAGVQAVVEAWLNQHPSSSPLLP